MATLVPNKCRFCGCTNERACLIHGAPCGWLDYLHLTCTNPACVFAAGVEHGMRTAGASPGRGVVEVRRCLSHMLVQKGRHPNTYKADGRDRSDAHFDKKLQPVP